MHDSALPLLNRVLDSLALGTVHLTESTLRGESGVRFPDDFPATCLHQVRQGVVWLEGPGLDARRLAEGDVAWVLRAAGHLGRTSSDAVATELAATRTVVGPGVAKRLECGRGEVSARVFTSHLLWTGPLHPLFDLLPAAFVAHAGDLDPAVESLLELLASERALGVAGSEVVAARLTELLWIHLVRQAAAGSWREPGLLTGLSHPGVARAMSAIADDPSRAWTLEDLGRAAGMSRTNFARVFRERVGLTPFEYVRRWRIHLAQILLRDPDRGIESVADEVGYASSVSFTRSFAAVTGLPPGQWRRTAGR